MSTLPRSPEISRDLLKKKKKKLVHIADHKRSSLKRTVLNGTSWTVLTLQTTSAFNGVEIALTPGGLMGMSIVICISQGLHQNAHDILPHSRKIVAPVAAIFHGTRWSAIHHVGVFKFQVASLLTGSFDQWQYEHVFSYQWHLIRNKIKSFA